MTKSTPTCSYTWKGPQDEIFKCTLPRGHQPENRHQGCPIRYCICKWVRQIDPNCAVHKAKEESIDEDGPLLSRLCPKTHRLITGTSKMTPDPYHYEAGNVGGNTWMVKRWTTDRDDYTEALITRA